jgi:hypothetical protein
MSILLSVLVLVVGLLMYLLAANPKVQEVGRIMFFSGLFVFLMGSEQVIAIIRGV